MVEDIGNEGSDMKEMNILRWLRVQISYMSDALSTFGITIVSKFGACSFSQTLITFLVILISRGGKVCTTSVRSSRASPVPIELMRTACSRIPGTRGSDKISRILDRAAGFSETVTASSRSYV